MFHTKATVEGIHTILPDYNPIRACEIFYITKFESVWMNAWKQQSVTVPNAVHYYLKKF